MVDRLWMLGPWRLVLHSKGSIICFKNLYGISDVRGNSGFPGLPSVCSRPQLVIGNLQHVVSVSCLPTVPRLFHEHYQLFCPPYGNEMLAPMRLPVQIALLFGRLGATHVSSECCRVPSIRRTWLEDRENHFMGVRTMIYSSSLQPSLL